MLARLALLVVAAAPAADLPAREGRLEAGRSAVVTVPAPERSRDLSVVLALDGPARLPAGREAATATVALGETTLNKALHLGDPDVTWAVRQPAGTAATVTLKAADDLDGPLAYRLRVADLGAPADDGVAFEVEPNDRPEQANPLHPGRPVYGLADDRPYLPLGEAPTEAEQTAGADWFRLDVTSETPRLAFFTLDYVDRDVPPDVRIFVMEDGTPVEYTEGIDPQSLQRERPPRPGANKFTTRVLKEGTYYVLVDACQPEYQLRVTLQDPPPYLKKGDSDDPEAVAEAARRAVRAAMDFQLLAGDSWHANTPRHGHTMDRVSNFHHETSTCIACHPTHFTTQSALTAVKNGYKVEQPLALRFLTERLYNNPVPFYGHPDALWARMIPAPANVLGRLSTMLMDFEDRVAGPERNHTHRGIAEFLKLYYDGRDAIPPDESNGNNPVSRYKVATDSWRQLDAMARRTGDARYAETRDLVARLLPTGEPAHLRDLAAQTIGLCTVGRERFADKIRENVARLLELQHDDGQWSIQFDPKAMPSQMQTGECLYALALAGLPADHPALLRGAAALLTLQKPFGGWFDTNPYEQFRTPFRETQWSLMALAQLYPGPGTTGWDNPLGPQPAGLRADAPSALVRDLERFWDAPNEELLTQVAAQLDHEQPHVRLAAARALSRVGGEAAIDPLARALGDPSKAVRRAAAEALRSLGNRLGAAHQPGESPAQAHFLRALTKSLRSPDDRTRRGATRVFAAHFRELSQESPLADVLMERLDDPDPVVQMQAIKGLWRWWYWRADLDLRNRIEDRLIAELAEPHHSWVRRNLTEALYILGDENIRYLFKNWVPSLAKEEDRDRATAAQHATVDRLGRKFAAALEAGNALQREGVLRAISEFGERPAITDGRVGNDIEPMLFYEGASPALSAALIGPLGDPDPTIRRLALQALVALRGHRDPGLARAVLARRGDEDDAVRSWAERMAVQFPPRATPGGPDPALLAVLDELAANPRPEAQVAMLSVLSQIEARPEAVAAALDADAAPVRAAALRALPSFPDLLADREIRSKVASALADDAPDARIAAVRLTLDRPGLASERALRRALEDDAPEHRLALLDAIQANKKSAADLRLVGVISNALVDDNGGVREKALQVIQAHPALVGNPAVEEGLRELTDSDNARQKEIAAALLRSRGRSSAAGGAGDVLDLAYFEAKILPIFNAPGEDGQNCMECHRSHTILKMTPPDRDGGWSPAAVRANFRATLRVVDLARPTDSLLLKKPTWEAAEEAEAQSDPTKKAHAGGVRFEPGDSPEYQAILDWINGARLAPGARAAR